MDDTGPVPDPVTTGGGLRSSTENGMLLMAAAMLMVPCLDALAKALTDAMSPGQVTLGRFAFQSLFLLPLVLTRWGTGGTGPTVLHAVGGALVAGAVMFLVWSLKYMPIANAIAIFFVEPLILTLMSAVLLREQVGWRRIAGVVVGLVGALIVIRPNWAAFGWIALLPLATATAFAGYLVVTRHLALRSNRIVLQFWIGVFAALTLAVATVAGDLAGQAVLTLRWPEAWQWGLLAFTGFLSMATHLMVAHAFGRAPASVLAPFQYLEIVSATALGLIVFGDFPDTLTWLGTAIIIGSGLYIFHRERRLAIRAAGR